METYTQQKQRHSKEFSDFEGIFFAFSNDQFFEGVKKIGLDIEEVKNSETKLIVSIGAGGYIRKDRVSDYIALCNRHSQERKDLKKNEKKLVEALLYELGNHEYGYTMDATDAVEALGYTMENVPQKALNKAIKKYNELEQARETLTA